MKIDNIMLFPENIYSGHRMDGNELIYPESTNKIKDNSYKYRMINH